jgi:hypothetical protein
MAAEPTRIKLKRSTTAAVVPTTSNLVDGEVAVNIADRKIYVNNSGTIVEVANQKPNTGEVTTSMLATDITNGPGNTYYVATSGSNSNTLGSGGDNGKHPDTPFLTVAKALSVATAGDTVNIAAGTYQETFPLTVPDGVTLRGANLRSTQITPTPATNDLNAFILQGDCHVSDLTVKDFFYNSGNDTGYGFVCASSLDSDRSPYIERVSVLTKGSVTSASDPYGFAQGDAGRGAKLDGAVFSSNSIETAVLFNEVTFIVPNSVGLLLTNGVRVEWLNSFVYFAAEGIKGEQGATGRAGAGQTRLKLAGVSGTFSGGEVIYQLEDSFQSGTYSRTGTTVTVTKTAHGLVDGEVINADFISGTATDGYYTVANSAANTFDVTDTASGTTSGNITFKKADAYGTITTNDGTYLLINGKGVGEFTVGVPTGKTGVIAGDAQLDTAQQKFGTASLLLDGVTDHLSYPTSEDFGFGTTNFAFECFIRPTATTGTQYFLDFRDGSDTDTAPTMYLDGTTLHFAVGNTSQISGGTLSAGTWYHVAAARFGGTTRLFLDGTQLGTYTDSNDYGATKPLGIGGEYSGTNEFGGHIDEIRVSKATARYTGAFTAPTAAFTTDLNTVLLLHFDGTDGSTTITDSGKGVRDIRSSGGDSATSLLTADYAQFGAELRSISSANIYGTKGAIADGAGVKLLLTAHNFAYIGSGADFTNDPDLAIPANEVTETNGGRIFYSATNEKGDFRIGDAFVVDQQTGNVQFQSTSTAQEAANITLSDPTGTTRIFPAFVETGNLRLSGNTLSSTSGNVIIDPSANEDILLNAEVFAVEDIHLDNTKTVSIGRYDVGSFSVSVYEEDHTVVSGYGLTQFKNFRQSNFKLNDVTITNEGSDYPPGSYTFTNVVTPPDDPTTATATLSTTGSVKSIALTNQGSGYTTEPTVTFTPDVDSPTASVSLTTKGEVVSVNIDNGGSGYGSTPNATFSAPPSISVDADDSTSVDFGANTFTISDHNLVDDVRLIYDNGGNSNIGGLTNGNTYYVIRVDSDTFKLSASQGGSEINITTTTGTHSFSGVTATGTVTLTGGVVTGVNITDGGSLYSTAPGITLDVTPTGSEALLNSVLGFSVESVTISSGGTYTAAPSVAFSAPGGSGTSATGTSALGFPIASITLTNTGSGYKNTPRVSISGGTPTQDATIDFVLDKTTGRPSSVTLSDAGINYSSAPTITFVGGSASDGTVTATVQSIDANIQSSGSGYVAGVYQGVALTSTTGTGSGATATLTVPGLSGSITAAGSGYEDNTYTSVSVINEASTTYTVAVVSRQSVSVGTISGGSFSVGGSVSFSGGATGTITSIDKNGTNLRFSSLSAAVSGGETVTQGGVTATTENSPATIDVFTINGTEGAAISLQNYDTYKFDQSNSTNGGHPLRFSGFNQDESVSIRVGTPGQSGAYTLLVITSAQAVVSDTLYYECETHGEGMGHYVQVTNGAGSPGVYGINATADVTVSGGQVTEFSLVNQGTYYKINDVISAIIGTTGSGFEYTISANVTGVTSVTDYSTSAGTGYTIGDSLSADPTFDGAGNGGGFALSVTKVGFVTDVIVNNGGFNFRPGELVSGEVVGFETTGTESVFNVNTVVEEEVGEINFKGEFAYPNFTLDELGNFNLGSGIFQLNTPTSTLTFTGTSTFTGNSTITGTLAVNTSISTPTLTTTFSTSLADATIALDEGSASAPSLNFTSDVDSGLFYDQVSGGQKIGIAIAAAQVAKFSASTQRLVGKLTVSPDVNGSEHFFTAIDDGVDKYLQLGESSILTDSSLRMYPSSGTDFTLDLSQSGEINVGLTVSAKGSGDYKFTGAGSRQFLIGDSSDVNAFIFDCDSGELSVPNGVGSGLLKLKGLELANSSTAALRSFGEVASVALSGTATGYTNNTYTGVPSTTNGSGTGATFDVVVSGGDIITCTPTTNGRGYGYEIGDTITLDTATIGSGSGKTITVSTRDGLGVEIKPSSNRDVRIKTTSSLVIPAGTTNDRPAAEDRLAGAIRFNTQQQQFEGYNGSDFVSLGGVRDVDQDTYILTESAPGVDEDTFEFYAAGVNFLSLNNTTQTYGISLVTVVHAGDFEYRTPGTLTLNGTSTSANALNLNVSGSTIASIRPNKDFELTNGLRLRAVPAQGSATLLDNATLTQTLGAYTPGQTFNGLATSAQIEGTGLTVNVSTNSNGDVVAIVISSGGSRYEVGEVITISGTDLGGTASDTVTIEVSAISATTTEFARLDILYPEYRLQLQSKPFINYDGFGSQAEWQINRGWNGGTESYLTVFDSTATFMELDDCRLEGGQISSFGASSTIVQFDKTSFKGAKTLVTIESDDGKVHMLEVTSVCAASGTTAYATITNSVTSANDLVDADVVVVGNNVQVNLTKSAAATSSTSFTGRFTTTKVKV